MESTALDINARVKLQYEAYPYPDYSLFIPLRTQEAYASHSIFCAQLLRERGRAAPALQLKNPRILIAGCGDILPFVLSFWEPESHHIHAVDLSERNIQRARFRSTLRPHAFHWQAGNLEDTGFPLPEAIAHVDSYGVLHHLANPTQTLQRLHHQMLPGATMRVMVYNSEARGWIQHLQRAFAVLGLSAFDRKDLDHALRILQRLDAISPLFRQRLTPMKAGIFHHSARFVDTFFHAREARIGINHWLESFARIGFESLGLFDRYAELDDLKNPLLLFPSAKSLEVRAQDRRFENNFEIYLTKKASPSAAEQGRGETKLPTRFRLRMPPKAWFTYSETHSIPWPMRFQLWHNFLRTLEGRQPPVSFDRQAITIKPEALQRLSRLGAIFPSNFDSQELRALLLRPIHPTMDQPSFAPPAELRQDLELRQMLETLARSKGKSQEALDQVFRRLEAAQKP